MLSSVSVHHLATRDLVTTATLALQRGSNVSFQDGLRRLVSLADGVANWSADIGWWLAGRLGLLPDVGGFVTA